jgi:tetratricopeptide (TPR) repeat protein/TolB-like protein
MLRAFLLCVCCVCASVRLAVAQCPDGTPPPCPSARRAPVARPLDDRNWLVLPFDNIARDPALEMVRDASVTLLYSAMSQWSDLLVVDDARVADLMRGLPAGTRIGQDMGFDLARRVGAGKLVMGTLLKEGSRTRVQAAVYDVRSGRRLRSPSTATVGTDSLSMVFAALAEQVLAVPAPPGVRVADVGTKNSEALRAYVLGLEAERRWVFDTAVTQFRRAVALDSAFGLAHYHIYRNIGSLPDVDAAEQRRALAAAQRFAAGMPRRERNLVAANGAVVRGDMQTTCTLVDRMLAADSLDALATYWHGACRWQLLANDTGTVLARFRSVNAQIADWRRAAELDSTLFEPVEAVLGVLQQSYSTECVEARAANCPPVRQYVSAILVDHDTLVFRPYLVAMSRRDALVREPGQYASYRRRLEMSRDLAAAFVAANPGNWAGHYRLAYALQGLGNLSGALRELEAGSGASRFVGARRLYYLRRFEIALRQEKPREAASLADSIFADRTVAVSTQAGGVLGRYSLEALAMHRGNDSLIALRQALQPLWAGVLPVDVDALAQRYAQLYAVSRRADAAMQEEWLQAIPRQVVLLAFRMRRTRPVADTADPRPILRSQSWFALGDTARSRQALQLAEAEVESRPVWASDDGSWLFIAEGYVLLGDSAAALRRLGDFAARWPSIASNVVGLVGGDYWLGNSGVRAWGRAWLLYGDLAAAAGDAEQARRAYRFVVGLWEGGEAPVQPLVARARAALARLGN